MLKLPKEIQTMIYKHVFNSVLNDMKDITTDIKKHFLTGKRNYPNPSNRSHNIHDCNIIDVIGFNNDHEIHHCKCAYFKKGKKWDIDYYGNTIRIDYFDENYEEDDLIEEENYDSY